MNAPLDPAALPREELVKIAHVVRVDIGTVCRRMAGHDGPEADRIRRLAREALGRLPVCRRVRVAGTQEVPR